MDLKAFFESLKDYFLDVIGFLIPGIMLFIYLSITVQDKFFLTSPLLKEQPSYYTFLFLVVTYVLGYLVYGLGVAKDNFLDSRASSNKIEEKIRKSDAFTDALKKYENYTIARGLNQPKPTIRCRELRSIIMTFNKDEDNNKIYKFMYRSDLCKHIGNTSLVIGIFGILNYVVSFFTVKFIILKTEPKYVLFYFILILSHFFFRAARNYFYDIAIKTPFDMYLAR